jgi:hypothetical protein
MYSVNRHPVPVVVAFTKSDLAFPQISNSVSHTSQENVQCIMVHIENVAVILDDISRTAHSSVTESAALKVIDAHARSSCRDSAQGYAQLCHGGIYDRSADPQKDLVTAINLVWQYYFRD